MCFIILQLALEYVEENYAMYNVDLMQFTL